MNPRQLSYALHKTLEKQKALLERPKYPQIKVQWIKKCALDILDNIDRDIKRFNSQNPGNEIAPKDIVSAISTALNLVLKSMGIKPKRD